MEHLRQHLFKYVCLNSHETSGEDALPRHMIGVFSKVFDDPRTQRLWQDRGK